MTKVIIQNNSGGIVNDPRNTSTGVAKVVSNFDINTSPNRLIPYRSSVDGNSNSANDFMQNWCIALRTGTTYSLYGLGRQTATNKVRIFFKNLTTGAATDLDDNGWSETSNNLATQATPSYECFFYYKSQGLIFGLHGHYIWSYDPSGSVAFGDTLYDVTSFTNCAQGLVHSKDDKAYVPVDNKIYVKDGSNAFVLGLTLPAQYYITSISEFNNYIAIGVAPLDGVSNSRVFIWDRSTTLATISESIDWGTGKIKVIEEINGYLIGIGLVGGSSTTFNDRLVFRYYTGAGAISFTEILGTTSTVLASRKQKINSRIYFAASISLNGSVRDGVWSFGKNPNGQGFNLVHERTPNNDTSIGAGPMAGFFYIGDFLFQAYTNASAVFSVSKTNDQATYSSTSIKESVINEGMRLEDRPKLKQLKSICIGYKTLSAISGQIVVKYKVDSGSYTTVCTCTTTGLQVLEFKDASGVPFTAGREYEFRIESTLGADEIYFDYDYEVLSTLA